MVVRIGDVLSENVTRNVVEAHQFPVKAVKLFQGSNCAEVTRKFPLSFFRSQDEPQVVEIVHLPASIQFVDVSVTSTAGNVTIIDYYRTCVSQSPDSAISSQTLRELEAERKRLEDEMQLRQQSLTFLTTYMDSLAQCKSGGTQPEAAQMVTFFDEFVEIGATRSAAIAELDGKLADIGNKIFEETERLTKFSSRLPVKVVAILSCNSQLPVDAAELTVTYVVTRVQWKPTYDIHVTMAGNTPSPRVNFDFRCTVTQWTGEDWENINLALTTANQVSQLIQLPEPKRINISHGSTSAHNPGMSPIVQVYPQYSMDAGDHYMPTRRLRRNSYEHSEDSWGDAARWDEQLDSGVPRWRRTVSMAPTIVTPPHFLAAPRPVPPVVYYPPPVEPENMLSDIAYDCPTSCALDVPSPMVPQLISHDSKDPITHIASGCIFIPSDHTEHHVLVASFPLQAEFMRVVVPSVDTRVYYTCEVKNTSEYVLLPGTVKTYLNDKQVSSTEIHSTDLPQILECPLAVDTGMKTVHSRAPDALPSVAAFTGKATTTYTSATVLHNVHTEAICGTIVRSSIPLPADPRITIILKEPAGLADIDEGSVSVKEGCLARWSTTGGRKGKEMGLFEWVCDMDPGTEVLKAVWEVRAPRDLKLLEQERT